MNQEGIGGDNMGYYGERPHSIPYRISALRLLDVDDARPVDEQFVVLRRLVAAGFRGGDDREPLLYVRELHLQRLARERHVLLRRRDVAREPE